MSETIELALLVIATFGFQKTDNIAGRSEIRFKVALRNGSD